MATTPKQTADLDQAVDSALDEELDIDFDLDASDVEDIDLDLGDSLDDFEARIDAAAGEIASAGKSADDTDPAGGAAAAATASAAAGAAAAGAVKDRKPAIDPAADAALTPKPSAQTDAGRQETPRQPAAIAAANDDRQRDHRALLKAMNRRSSTAIYWVIAGLCVVWILGGMAIGDMLFSPQIWEISSFQEFATTPYAIGLSVAILVPCMLFWAFGVMVRRAQDMKLAAQSMTEIAYRLAEPEHLATDRVATVGQAVRREVQALGEGIERTLARAVELETLVHSEVNELERAYSDN